MSKWLLICIAAFLVMCSSYSVCQAQEQGGRGQHKKIYVTPVAEPVKVDGDLSDWDLSGQILSYVIKETMDRQSARIAMMYDDEALYISGVVRDDSPMMNRHDPQVDPRKAWNADVCQIFLSLDPDASQPLPYSRFKKEDAVSPVATMYLWYFTDRQEPNMAMYHGMGFKEPVRSDLHAEGLIPRTHFQAAYRKAQDNQSYTFEYRIPWTTLSLKRVPDAGDKLATTVSVFWGKPDGLETAGSSAWVNDVLSKPGFPFQESSCWGAMWFSPVGNLPKEMISVQAVTQMPNLMTLDYTLPKAGEVTVQLRDQERRVRRILLAQAQREAGDHHETWDGLDDHGKPLPAGQYDVQMLVHDPIKTQWRFSAHNSGNPPWPTDDGTGGWGGDHGSPTTVAALPDGMLLAWKVSEYGWGIIRTDLQGQKLWGSKHNAKYLATDGSRFFAAGGHGFHMGEDVVRLFAVADGRPLNFDNGQPALQLQLNASQDNHKQAAEKAQVTGLAYRDGRVYVSYASLNKIAVFDADSGELLKTLAVASPHDLAVLADQKLLVISDNKLVSIQQEKIRILTEQHLDQPTGLAIDNKGLIYVANQGQTQAVSVFNDQGQFLRMVGKLGGRPAKGAYDPQGMYMPGGIDIDNRGRLWVAETTDGPKRISVWETQTGENLKEFFGGSSYFGYGYIDPKKPDEILAHHVLWDIDWDTYQVKPTTTVWRKTDTNMVEAISPSGYRGTPEIFTADSGRQYMFGKTYQAKMILAKREGDLFKPFACLMNCNTQSPRYKGQDIPVIDGDPKTFSQGYYFWQDANDDQRVQAKEVTPVPDQFDRINIAWVNPDLSIMFNTGYKLPVSRISGDGQPFYDFAQLKPTFLATGRYAKYGHPFLWTDHNGSIYTTGKKLTSWTDDGQLQWEFPNLVKWQKALNKPIVGPGRLWGLTGMMGTAGDYLGMMTYFGVNHFFTRDGVYVAAVLKDGRLGGLDANNGQPEGQNGQFVKLNIKGSDRYFIIHGGQDSRVWEVTGLDTVKRLPTKQYFISDQQAKQVATEYKIYQQGLKGEKQLFVERGRDALDSARPIHAKVDEDRHFTARVAYDQDNLYLRYDVTSDAPLKNQISEPQLIFKGGNLIDFQIATDSQADANRKKPAPGDMRLLITMREGKAFAMRYRPKLAGFAGEPKVFTSPTGSESFDRIDQVQGIDIQTQSVADGFIAYVTIPLQLLDWKPKPGTTVQMDMGYIFGNRTGLVAAARAYWHNRGFSAYVTNDIPNESRLQPDEWGVAKFKP